MCGYVIIIYFLDYLIVCALAAIIPLLRIWIHTTWLIYRRWIMLRELIKGLVVVFMASSVIISNIFRSTRSDKPQLPAKNISGSASMTVKRDIPTSETDSDESNPRSTDG
jgi:hypothetical protein